MGGCFSRVARRRSRPGAEPIALVNLAPAPVPLPRQEPPLPLKDPWGAGSSGTPTLPHVPNSVTERYRGKEFKATTPKKEDHRPGREGQRKDSRSGVEDEEDDARSIDVRTKRLGPETQPEEGLSVELEASNGAIGSSGSRPARTPVHLKSAAEMHKAPPSGPSGVGTQDVLDTTTDRPKHTRRGSISHSTPDPPARVDGSTDRPSLTGRSDSSTSVLDGHRTQAESFNLNVPLHRESRSNMAAGSAATARQESAGSTTSGAAGVSEPNRLESESSNDSDEPVEPKKYKGKEVLAPVMEKVPGSFPSDESEDEPISYWDEMD